MFERQCQYSKLFSRFKAYQCKVCELQRLGTTPLMSTWQQLNRFVSYNDWHHPPHVYWQQLIISIACKIQFLCTYCLQFLHIVRDIATNFYTLSGIYKFLHILWNIQIFTHCLTLSAIFTHCLQYTNFLHIVTDIATNFYTLSVI